MSDSTPGPTPAFSKLGRRGLLFCIIGPSGSGKSTIASRLIEADSQIAESLSTTTRAPRPGEVQGQHYNFVTTDQFNQLAVKGAFLQHINYLGTSYGTLRAPVEQAMKDGRDTLFVVNNQGFDNLRKAVGPENVAGVYILPPSLAVLEARLKGRGQDSAEVIRKRMANAASELKDIINPEYIVVNGDLDTAVNDAHSIVQAERLRRTRQTGAMALAAGMLAKCTAI